MLLAMTGAEDPESGAGEEELQLQEQLEKQEKKKKQQFKDDIGVLVAMVLLALTRDTITYTFCTFISALNG